jgi:hypothetical protein
MDEIPAGLDKPAVQGKERASEYLGQDSGFLRQELDRPRQEVLEAYMAVGQEGAQYRQVQSERLPVAAAILRTDSRIRAPAGYRLDRLPDSRSRVGGRHASIVHRRTLGRNRRNRGSRGVSALTKEWAA